MNFQEKAALMNGEILDTLRNKPVTSTFVERWQLIDRAMDLYGNLPQPLKLGYGAGYILQNASLPIKDYDILLGRFDDHVPNDEEEAFVVNFRDTQRQQLLIDGGHITLDWAKVVKIGLDGYIAQTQAEYDKQLAAGGNGATLLFYMGYLLLLDAIKNYFKRYADAARAAGLSEAADICESVAGPAPTSFYAAMQLVMLLQTVYYVYVSNTNATLTLGRLDDILLDLYEADIACGRLTREDAGSIIDDFNAKCNLILGRGEHQMSGGSKYDTGWWRNNCYDDPTYVVIGGYSNRHGDRENPLTLLFAERINPRYENPVYICRYTPKGKRNEKAFDVLYDKMRLNSSMLIYNDDMIVTALENSGIKHEDAVEYTIHGCNWIDIPPKYCVLNMAGGSVAALLMSTLYELGEKPSVRQSFGSVDGIYDAFENVFRGIVRKEFNAYRAYLKSPVTPPDHISMTELFTEGVLEKGQVMSRAVEYPSVYTLIRHIATAADIMAAIDQLVFTEHKYGYDELLNAALADWKDYGDMYADAKKAPKYGTDNNLADMHAVRLMKLCERIADEETYNSDGVRDVYSLPLTISDMWHVAEGARLPGSPDGRHNGAPLSENLSPTAGYAVSVTALLNSVAKLPFERITAGALNVRLSKASVAGEEGRARMKILADTYFELGGMQIQVSVTDTSELRDAQKNPDNYKDLMVRITGYSAVFVDMAPSAQNEIIRRDELS